MNPSTQLLMKRIAYSQTYHGTRNPMPQSCETTSHTNAAAYIKPEGRGYMTRDIH